MSTDETTSLDKTYITDRLGSIGPVSNEVVRLGAEATKRVISASAALEYKIYETRPDSLIDVDRLNAAEWTVTDQRQFVSDAKAMYGKLGATSGMEGSVFDFTLISQRLDEIIPAVNGYQNKPMGIPKEGFIGGDERYREAIDRRNNSIRTHFEATLLQAELREEIALQALDTALLEDADVETIKNALVAISEAEIRIRTGSELIENHADWRAFDTGNIERIQSQAANYRMRAYDMKFAHLQLVNKLKKPKDPVADYKVLLREQLAEMQDLASGGRMSTGQMFEAIAICVERRRLLAHNEYSRSYTRLTTAREDSPADGHIAKSEKRHAHDIVTVIDGSQSYRYQLKASTKENWIAHEEGQGHVEPSYHDDIEVLFLSDTSRLAIDNFNRVVGTLRLAVNDTRPGRQSPYVFRDGLGKESSSMLR